MDNRKMEAGVLLILKGMGVDPTDPNFRDTPARVARLFSEMLQPRQSKLTTFPGGNYDSMVVLRNHTVFALCPHHLLPVEIKVNVGYIPNKEVLGLSKLARVAEAQLTEPIMQEDLTQRILTALWDSLEPKGVAVVLSGVHGCMKFRGIQSNGDVVTSAMKGQFLMNQATREEFMQIIGRP